ncbi:hypothetical protein LTR16_000116 [Cryomyces antarcticus]|uniref:RRM domain-containing protein n=1 Tax=Cryomyces antarcticus TaxID=329879 RepID=A0ABR0M075_9PEZI|nr:hypothetical protein LTR16_000116 [Cryomyces antarcticus]
MEYEAEPRAYEDEARYERERSRSPRPDRHGDSASRVRSASPNARDRMDRGPPPESRQSNDESRNSGSNLFVTGIHPRLSEEEVSRLFEKYGDVEKCNIMRDPHTRESRGFGFILMATAEQADAAKESLQGEQYEGRTLSIEKARRARPRTPTPGKYFGPPKREDDPRGPPRGGRYGGDRYDDRRGGGYGRRDDGYRGGSRYGDRHDDRGYGRRDRDDYAPRGIDRYASGGREDRYSSRGDDRRGGGYGGGYGRSNGRDEAPAAYGEPAGERLAPEPVRGGGRAYDDRGDDRYARR